MNVYITVAIVNVSLIILTGITLYWTHSFYSLLILFFLMSTKTTKSKDDNRIADQRDEKEAG